MERKQVVVIKGPLFEKVLQDAFAYVGKMVQRKLDEGGLERIRQEKAVNT